MSDLPAARSPMAMSPAFHLSFAAIGIAVPLLMVAAGWLCRTAFAAAGGAAGSGAGESGGRWG